MRGAQRGFTLVELVVTLVLTAILAGVTSRLITAPVEAHLAVARRAELTAGAELAMTRLARDIADALPNSLRVGCDGRCVELLRVIGGGRYRAAPPGDSLSFLPGDADDRFEVLGPLVLSEAPRPGRDTGDCRAGRATCVAVYNTGAPGHDAWNGDNLATLRALETTPAQHIRFDGRGLGGGRGAFPAPSPRSRFFLVSGPVKFLCDPVAGTLTRFDGYPVVADERAVDSAAELAAQANPAEAARLAEGVRDCRFAYRAGTATRNGVLEVRLTLGREGERVSLAQQFQVVNRP